MKTVWMNVGAIALALALIFGLAHGKKNVIYAQSVPYTATVTWTPNSATDNVTQYNMTLDAGTPQTVLPQACTVTTCTAQVSIGAFGSHNLSVTAQNCVITGGGATCTIQVSNPATISFALNQKPTPVNGVVIK
jgi:hypothetical protein